MSDFDDMDEVVKDLMRMADRILSRQVAGRTSPAEQRGASGPVDEVIDGKSWVTYLLQAPGYALDHFRVSVTRDEIEAKTPDMVRRVRLPSSVDPDSVKSTYHNGVLSVRVKKA